MSQMVELSVLEVVNNHEMTCISKALCSTSYATSKNLVRWKTRSAGCGVWKVRIVESAECGKCGVWKVQSVENFNFPFQFQFSISISGEMRRNNVLTIKKKKNRDESLHFKMRRAGMVMSVVVFTNPCVVVPAYHTSMQVLA